MSKIVFVTFLYNQWFDLEYEYLIKLYSAIQRNCSFDFDFYCLTDETNYRFLNNINDSRIHLLRFDIPKKLNHKNLVKLSVYNPNNEFLNNNVEKIVILDLDLLIVNSLDDILQFDDFDILIRAQFRSLKTPDGDFFILNKKNIDFNKTWKLINRKSGEIYTKAKGHEVRFYCHFCHIFFNNMKLIQNYFQNYIVSYKFHIKEQNKIPKDTRIISFHGNPKPHELLGNPIIEKYWKY